MSRNLIALTAVLLAASAPARAEDPGDAGKRLAGSLLRQLAAHPPQPAVTSVSVAPAGQDAPAAARDATDALGAALAAPGTGVQVRDWSSLDRELSERARSGALQGDLGLPPLAAVQAIVITEAAATGDGKVRLQARLVAIPSGAALAADSATLDPEPAEAALAPPAVNVTAPIQSASIEVTMRRLADALAAGFYKLPGTVRYRRLAVLDFAEAGAESRKRELGRVVSAELATNLRRDHDLFLVERSRLGAVLAELKLAQMGAVDAAQAAQVGRLADAQALVVGTVSDAGDRFLVNARIVSAETGDTLAAASEAISAASLIALSTDAVVLRSKKDAVFRSLVAPGWGQLYNREPKKAVGFAAAEAAALTTALVFHLRGKSAEDAYRRRTTEADLGSDPSAEAARLRHDAESAYRTRNTALWIALGVWAVNVADAWYSGVDGDKLLATAAPIEGGTAFVVAGRF